MTKFSVIYEQFKDLISDYDLPMYEQSIQEEMLFSYLKKAISRFRRICKNSLEIDIEQKCIVSDLTDEEIEILYTWMIYFWITPYVNNNDNLRNILNTKDFSTYSPANLVNAIANLQKNSKKEALSLQSIYSIVNGDVQLLKRK